MGIQFIGTEFPYLKKIVGDIQNIEQTQELKLPDGMPDIGNVFASWGQIILRSKEWRSDSILFSGGVMVWVLYQPADSSELCRMETWIPFQMKWDIPDDSPDGKISVCCFTRFVDSRSVTPRKIMVRVGIAAMGEAFVRAAEMLYSPQKDIDGIELRKKKMPVQLPCEAGEKVFSVEEDITSDYSGEKIKEILFYTVDPEVTDQKVLGNKTAFRGNLNLHVGFKTESSKIYTMDFLLPFSQFADLESAYGSEAGVSVRCCITELEVEALEDGQLTMKASISAQYQIFDSFLLEVVEDVYSLEKELTVTTDTVHIPVCVSRRREVLSGEMNMPDTAKVIVDCHYMQDFPRQQKVESGVYLDTQGMCQVLYYDAQDHLCSAVVKVSGGASLSVGENEEICVIPMHVRSTVSGGHVSGRIEIPIETTVTAGEGVQLITSVEVGETRKMDPNRPSLILRRAGASDLWQIAKMSGSTVAAIQKANQLEKDPIPGQILLIPVL